jgi:hypothetical protein
MNVSATVSGALVNLAWNWASNGVVAVTNYIVKRSQFNGGPYTTIATVNTTNFTDSGLSGGLTYYYVVSSYDSTLVVESTNSTQVSAVLATGSANNPVWDGGDNSSRLWSASTNWVGEVGQGSSTPASSITFADANNTGTASVPLTNGLTGVTFTNLNFWTGASSFVITGNTLTNAGNIINYSATPQTFSAGMVMAYSTNLHYLNVGTSSLTLGGAVSAPAAFAAVAKTGPGTLNFTSPLTNTLANGNLLTIGPEFAAAFNVDEGPVVFNGGSNSLYNITGEIAIGRESITGNTNVSVTVSSGKVAVAGTTSLARANETGSVSSDLILSNAATWTTTTLLAGNNNGDTTRTPRGSLKLNNTSTFTVTGNTSAFAGR